MRGKNLISSDLQLLECTLRDGSYAVDFRFTNEDTALLCGFLSRLGFKFIEIGHGFGINASNAGKGNMPSSDKELLEIAKSSVRDSQLGMFCIPNIATLGDLKEMGKAGLDFVRIGDNAESIEEAFPYIEVARENNLYTMLNFMKSYAISPKEFAQKAKEAVRIGAQVIYLVDSAGGMLPEEIVEYIKEIRTVVDVKIGLHGHNNLHLATANAIQAVKNGTTFIDTTLYGIGRSAGNVPTEVMLAILNNMGIDIGVDLFELMDVAEKYLSPLMDRIQMHDMLSVAMGAGKFHSSFFPQVKKVAEEYKTDVRKLVYIMGKKDPSSVNEKELKETAENMGSVDSQKADYDITSFYSPKIGKHYISNTLKSVTDLMEGLVNVSSKGRRKIVLELVPTNEPAKDMVLAEYVTADNDMVMGRIRFGSVEMADTVLKMVKNQVSLLLLDIATQVSWLNKDDLISLGQKHLPRRQIIPIESNELLQSYLFDILRIAACHYGNQGLLIYGGDYWLSSLIKMCSNKFKIVYWISPKEDFKMDLANIVILKEMDDWLELDFKFNVIFCVNVPRDRETKILLQSLADNGKIITMGSMSDLSVNGFQADQIVSLDLSHIYIGMSAHWLQVGNALNAS